MSEGVKPLEELIYNASLNAVGNPVYLGILVLAFFGAFVMLQGGRTDLKIGVLSVAFLLASAFIPWLGLIISLIIGGVIYLALHRLTQR